MPPIARSALSIVATLTLLAGSAGMAHAEVVPPGDAPVPVEAGAAVPAEGDAAVPAEGDGVGPAEVTVPAEAGAPIPADTAGAIPVEAPADERGDQTSRDESRPLLPEAVQALNNRQAALDKLQVDISLRERTLRANEFVKQRAAVEKKVRYAEQVEKLGYDPKKTPPRDIAKAMMLKDYEWGEDQFKCLDKIFTQESRWKWNATNPTSGAYGIPQSLPANKMASEGDDWKTNPATQIKWGLKYIKQRYGTPCQAWSFKRGTGWY